MREKVSEMCADYLTSSIQLVHIQSNGVPVLLYQLIRMETITIQKTTVEPRLQVQ